MNNVRWLNFDLLKYRDTHRAHVKYNDLNYWSYTLWNREVARNNAMAGPWLSQLSINNAYSVSHALEIAKNNP